MSRPAEHDEAPAQAATPNSPPAATGTAEDQPTQPNEPPHTEDDHAPIEAAEIIPADRAGLTDDGYETDRESSASTSVTSSIRDYEFENSRRYHKFQEGRYQFPNDEPEQEREDMKHAMVVHLCDGKLHFAPLDNPQNILDIGTGTGIWAIDMGDEFPEAEILGIDLSPIQTPWVPPNVRFMVDDAEAEWVQAPNSLDYIHIRNMTAAIRDWPALLSRAYEALKPGGWIELQELCLELKCDDGSLKPDNKLQEWLGLVRKGLMTFGVDMLSMRNNKQRTLDAGFANVQEKALKIPFGIWPKDKRMSMIGLYCRTMMVDALHGVSSKPFLHGLKWTPEQIEVYLVGVRKECYDYTQHTHIPFTSVTGQKPE
ncbi:unnamed protein product [Clonostachys solani]|uniref:Secondary metabolism regulator LAE1 n=1 Tax=Clonostachys solani TaxID=160281 RepID=A0A9N9Z094_9HYPO|nr:unnamed protein product [Clonostachys solani]